MNIRKPIDELTLDDLGKLPIREFRLDEEGRDTQEHIPGTVNPYQSSGSAGGFPVGL